MMNDQLQRSRRVSFIGTYKLFKSPYTAAG